MRGRSGIQLIRSVKIEGIISRLFTPGVPDGPKPDISSSPSLYGMLAIASRQELSVIGLRRSMGGKHCTFGGVEALTTKITLPFDP